MLINAASPTMINVPTMALPKPPPSAFAVGGSEVNVSQLSLCKPLVHEHVDHGKQRRQRRERQRRCEGRANEN